jgi:probable phosphoglycerate mutase
MLYTIDRNKIKRVITMGKENKDQMKNGKVILYLMRHGQTIINKAGRVQGWCDGVLTDDGVIVAENVALGLSDIEFKSVYSSDLGRAIKTARIIVNANKVNNKLTVNEIPELREMYFGKYEGEKEKLMFKDIFGYLNVKSFEEAFNIPDFGRAFADACASLDETGAAEGYDKLISRIMKGVNNIGEEILEAGGGNALVVVHGGMLRNLLKEFDEKANIENIENSSVSLVEYENGSFKVLSVNDMSYKEKGESMRVSRPL